MALVRVPASNRPKVRAAVVRKPRLLGMSLEKRLLPRLHQIRAAGFTPSWDLHHEVSRVGAGGGEGSLHAAVRSVGWCAVA